jgi:hypothetical protein
MRFISGTKSFAYPAFGSRAFVSAMIDMSNFSQIVKHQVINGPPLLAEPALLEDHPETLPAALESFVSYRLLFSLL